METLKNVELLKGSFTPSEVKDLILKSLNNQINNLKLKNLSQWIHDHNCDQDVINRQIEKLESRKKDITSLINKAHQSGCELKIDDTINIELNLTK